MIDPVVSLSFSIQSNRGVYALLLGSGISRASKIPTGWEITLDLIRKIAASTGEDCGTSPENWFKEKYGFPADYSKLLNMLAKNPPERQQLLRPYFEANEDERAEGSKQPTQAHRAIALLVQQGFVRVLITTNFDHLLEIALKDAGVEPTIISTPDQALGSLPLVHTSCCLFKVNGDYMDTRIKNTPEELETFPAEFDALLAKIFDDFGLIICGWSGKWDIALRNAITRSPSRRFSFYWTFRGDIDESSKRLIGHRGMETIRIDDADSFFVRLQEQVQAIGEFSRSHPLSTLTAVATLKKYLSEPKYRIQMSDLVNNEIERALEVITGPKFSTAMTSAPETSSFTNSIKNYESACETLLALAVVGGAWAEKEHFPVWQKALVRLFPSPQEGGAFRYWSQLRKYPAMLFFYTLGISAVENERWDFLGAIFSTVIHSEYEGDKTVSQMLDAYELLDDRKVAAQLLEGMKNRRVPVNDWLHKSLRKLFTRTIPDDNRYSLDFDRLEILIALSFAHYSRKDREDYWAPPGAYCYRDNNRKKALAEVEESLLSEKSQSKYVTSKIFGNNHGDCIATLEGFKAFIAKLGQLLFF
jgi:hypothetical protein